MQTSDSLQCCKAATSLLDARIAFSKQGSPICLHLLLHLHSAADNPDGLLQACIPKAYLTIGW